MISEGIAAGFHSGAQIFVAAGGETVADAGVGEASPGVPVSAETILPWMSSGKPITSVAIAQQLERGKLKFDDPVAKFIPEFGVNGKEGITIRHLLTHTGGFRSADKISSLITREETLKKICAAPLEEGWVPGEKAGYHLTSSWFVLGEIVQRLDGRSYSHYVREEIFGPLGMKDSWLGMPAEVWERYGQRMGPMQISQNHELHPHPSVNGREAAERCQPGSNVRGPVHDLGAFYRHLLRVWKGEAGIIAPETLRLFASRQRVGLFDHTFMHKLDWGLGFQVNSNRYGLESVPYGFGKHSGESAFGHSGAQSSTGFADPDHEVVIAWVCNGMPGERLHQKRARAINTAIYEDLGLTEGASAA